MHRFLVGTLIGVCALACLLAATPALAAKKVARAKVADLAKNAKRVNGIRASRTPTPGRLLALDALGKFPLGVIPAGALPNFSAGFGLGLNNNVFSANPTVLQRRVGSFCSPGEAIREIKEDGTVSCVVFPAPNGDGDITAVNTTAGSGLTGGDDAGDVTLDTDFNTLQKRISTGCAAGRAMTAVDAAGGPTCNAFGDIMAVNTTAGSGLTGGATSADVTLDTDFNILQKRISGCAAGQAITAVDAEGLSSCVNLALVAPLRLTHSAGNADEVAALTQQGTGPGLLVSLPAGNSSRGIQVSHQGVGPGVFSSTTGGNALWGIAGSVSSAAVIGDNQGGEAIVGRQTGSACPSSNCNGIGAVVGRHDGPNGYGVRGFVTDAVGGIGVLGQVGVSGGTGTAVRGENINASNAGNGVVGTTNGAGAGVFGTETSTNAASLAGRFDGNVRINGALTVTGTKTGFLIDDPSAPARRTLGHTPVESDSLTVTYSGNIRTDGRGRATVRLPAYAALVGEDWRYGLTPIERFGQAIVAREVRQGAFVIRTEHPRTKVSWTVTGTRRDPYALDNPFVPSRPKRGADRGRYIHPGAYGQPASLTIGRLSRASALGASAAAARPLRLTSSLPAGGRR